MYVYCICTMNEWLFSNGNSAIFQPYHGENKLIFNEMMMRSALIYTNTELDFYSASSQKQQSTGRHVAPLGHIIQIPSQPVFARSLYCCLLSREVTNTNFIVFGLIWPGLEPTIYCTRGEHANHYAIDTVKKKMCTYYRKYIWYFDFHWTLP
jgi:hypothetical protein